MEIWLNPRCSKCRTAASALDEAGVEYTVRRYLDEPPTREEIVDVLERLDVEPWHITRTGEAEAAAVEPAGVYALASSALGRRMAESPKVYREFSFSLLRPAGEVFPGAGEDELLLQGVVDCCFVEDGGLVVVDYKTDRVSASGAAACAERYRGQLECYAWAMERITGLKVRERLVYFLRPGLAVRV